MKSNEFAQTLNTDIFKIEFNRFVKLVTWLRASAYCGQHLFPDARQNGSAINPTHCAHLIRLLALNPNPFDRGVNFQIARAHCLRDSEGKYFTETLASFLANSGEEITKQGLVRVSFSQDRDTVIFVFRKPLWKNALNNYPSVSQHYVVREHEIIFGDQGPLKFERFSIVKQSALLQIAGMLSNKEVNISQD